MTLDDGLVAKAKDSGARLIEAERQVALAKADYHTMIRRLHLAGASFREIAGALELSHQRVQQIVDQAGGSWWSRVWRTRNQRDAVCTFCERPPSEVGKLIAGPDVFVCDGCVMIAARAIAGERTPETSGWRLSSGRARSKCSFCGKSRAPDRTIIGSSAGHVCSECLEQCRRILDARED